MFIVYDQTWKRNLYYGRFEAGELPAFWEANELHPISVFRTKKSAEAAITATQNYFWVDAGWSKPAGEHKRVPRWASNSYVIIPLKLERKK